MMNPPRARGPAAALIARVDGRAAGSYDKDMSNPANGRNVVFVLYEGIQLLDLAGAADVFAVANDLAGGAAYTVSFLGGAAPVRSSGGLMLGGSRRSATPRSIHTLIVPGANEVALRAALSDR